MYLLLTIKTPSDVAELIEEQFYFIEGLSWEREDKGASVLFKFYFPIGLEAKDEDILNRLEKISAHFPSAIVEYSLIEKENWETIWKYHFKPLAIGSKLLILPSWEDPNVIEDRIPIYIDPGQAFGTGHHATTQLMLENLEVFIDLIAKDTESPLVLDMGCGTGILAIATAKLCPKAKIYAVDIDPLALEATEKNAKLNQVSSQIVILPSVPDDKALKFDLILANIGYKELVSLASLFAERSREKTALLLLSGILREDLENLWQIYQRYNFKKIKTQFLKEWALLALRKG